MKKKIVRTKKNTWKMKWTLEAEDWLSILISVFVLVFVIIQVMR